MRKAIICEGKEDAVLVAYLLEKTYGWETKVNPKEGKVTILKHNDTDNEVHIISAKNNAKIIIAIP